MCEDVVANTDEPRDAEGDRGDEGTRHVPDGMLTHEHTHRAVHRLAAAAVAVGALSSTRDLPPASTTRPSGSTTAAQAALGVASGGREAHAPVEGSRRHTSANAV